MDPQQRGRVLDDLKGFFKGDLRFDDVARALYSTDASIFEVQPAGVLAPRDEEDVAALVRYCYENQIALHARGAGTGVSGESLGSGLMVDLSQSFRKILEVGPDWVRVQPGVTLRSLNERLAAEGRRFAPDTASAATCTLGGMLATNASGSHALRHGYTRDHVWELRAVLDNGEVARVTRQPWPIPHDTVPTHFTDIVSTLGVVLEHNQEWLRAHQPKTRFNRLGYLMHDLFEAGQLDLPKLLIGSEGTLCLFTEATLRTIPLPGGRGVVLLGFTSLDRALQAIPKVLAAGPAACELMDRRLLSLARGSDATEVASLVSPAAEHVLLVEFETDTPGEARRLADDLATTLLRTERLALHAMAVHTEAEIQRVWRLREVVLPGLYALRSGAQPVLGVEDVAVPVEALGEYLHRVQDILQEHETTASFLVHAGAGQVHTRPFLDLQKPADVAKLSSLAAKIHELALSLGGTISTQHGVGIARTSWVARQTGPLYPILRQIKAIFDPRNIFNPGKIVDPSPQQLAWPLRKFGHSEPPRWELRWQPLEVLSEANHCNGCGQCRTEAGPQRMCPLFRVTHQEAASPRAKANLLRFLFRDGGDSPPLSSDEVRDVADLCINCKMCHTECPAHVNIPKLMLEAKAANVAQHGLGRSDWFLVHLEDLARLGTLAPPVSNAILRSRTLRWLLGRLFGLSSRRRMPTFTRKTFMQLAQRRGWTRLPPPNRARVALFVDLYANYFDPQIAEAAALVLWHNGFDVYVPPGQRSSGIEALANGDVELARDLARRNLRILADLAREGVPIVCTEPSAALMFRNDYLDLLDDIDARLVAERTVEFTAFLGELNRQGKLRTDFERRDLTIGHHIPCHVKALNIAPAGPDLLRLIPGVEVRTIDKSCSGIAGTFGLKRENYEASRQAGAPMIEELRDKALQAGSTECSSCRMQMEDAANKRTLHPAQYLAWAYNLMPEVAQRLKEPIRDMVLR